MSKPKTKVIKWFIWDLFPSEKKAVHRGRRRAMCKAEDLKDTAMKAAQAARAYGAKSWDIIPLIQFGTLNPRVGIKLYNRENFGMCTFPPDNVKGKQALAFITGEACLKTHYWFDELPQPHHLDSERGVRDPSQGRDWHPELAG